MQDVPFEFRSLAPRFRRILALGFALALLGWGAAAVRADPQAGLSPPADRTVPLEALLRAVTVWVASELELPVPATLPAVVFTSPRSMVEMRYGMAANDQLRVTALYHARTQRIFLADDWTGETQKELSVLVHEMVHHVEAQAGVQFSCPNQRERSAYRLQEHWLAQFGIDFLRTFNTDRGRLARNTSCYR